MNILKLTLIIIIFFFISCEGEYSKTMIRYEPIIVEVFKPSPNDDVYHLSSNKIKIEENFILGLYNNDSIILVKSYKSKNGYVNKDSSYIYSIKTILVKESEISKEEYDGYIKENKVKKLWAVSDTNKE